MTPLEIILMLGTTVAASVATSFLILIYFYNKLNDKFNNIYDWTHHLSGDFYDLKEFLQNKTIIHDDIVNLHGAQITMHADDESRFEIVEAMIKKC